MFYCDDTVDLEGSWCNMNGKTKSITFRVDERLYKFLDDFSNENKMDVSSLCRSLIIFYFMSSLLHEVDSTGLDKRFFKKYGKAK